MRSSECLGSLDRSLYWKVFLFLFLPLHRFNSPSLPQQENSFIFGHSRAPLPDCAQHAKRLRVYARTGDVSEKRRAMAYCGGCDGLHLAHGHADLLDYPLEVQVVVVHVLSLRTSMLSC